MDKEKALLTFGQILRKVRKEAGLSQIELAKQSGLSHMSIRRYETGERLPEADSMLSISDALHGNEELFNAWAYCMKQEIYGMIPSEGTFNSMTFSLELGEKVQRHESNMIINRADSHYISQIWGILQSLESMNDAGRYKADETVSLLAKVPEYQKNKSED